MLAKFDKNNALNLFLMLFIFYSILEGSLRYVFFSFDLSFLSYSIKALMILLVVYQYLFHPSLKSLLVSLFVLLFFVNGLMINGLSSVVVSLLVMCPILFFYFYRIDHLMHTIRNGFFILMIFVSLTGLLLNIYLELPWIGFEALVSGYDIVVAKQWWSDGQLRLAGFGRSSIETATLLSFCCIVYFMRNKLNLFVILIAVASIYGVYLTTTKGAFVGLIFAFVFYLIPKRAQVVKKLFLITVVLIGNFVLLFPLLDFDANFFRDTNFSLWERINYMWPETFNKTADLSNLFGLGLGGVGVAASLQGDAWAAVDNFWLYIYATFGFIIWFCLLALSFMLCSKVAVSKYSCLYIFFFSYGITNNMIESIAGQVILALFLCDITNFKFFRTAPYQFFQLQRN